MSLQYLTDFESAEAHEDEAWAVRWLPCGAAISASADGTLRAWDCTRGIALGPPMQASESGLGVLALSVSLGASQVLASCVDGSVSLWSLQGLEQAVKAAAEHFDKLERDRDAQGSEVERDGEASGDRASATGTTAVLTRFGDPPIRLMQRVSTLAGKPFGTDHVSPECFSATLHPSDAVMAATGTNGAAYLYSTDEASFGEPLRIFEAGGVTGPSAMRKGRATKQATTFGLRVEFSDDGQLLAVATNLGETLLFDFASGAHLLTIADHSAPVRAVAFSHIPAQSGRVGRRADFLFLGGDDRILTIHDAQSLDQPPRSGANGATGTGGTNGSHAAHVPAVLGSTVGFLKGHRGWITAVAPAGDGRIIASCSVDGSVKLWDLAASPKACVMTATESQAIWGMAWKPTHDHHLALSAIGTVAAPSSSPATLPGSQQLRPSDFVTAGADGKLRWYRAAGVAQA